MGKVLGTALEAGKSILVDYGASRLHSRSKETIENWKPDRIQSCTPKIFTELLPRAKLLPCVNSSVCGNHKLGQSIAQNTCQTTRWTMGSKFSFLNKISIVWGGNKYFKMQFKY